MYSAVTWASRDIVSETKLDQMTENDSVFNSAITTGWIVDTDTWVYVSATSFKVKGKDVTATFTKGTKVRYKQGGAYEYGTVASSAFSTDTTVTLIANTDYALASAVITDAGYSYMDNPQGFPHWFNFTSTLTADGSMTVGSIIYGILRYHITGNLITCICRIYATLGGSASGGLLFTVPVAREVTADSTVNAGYGQMRQAGTEYNAKVVWNGTEASSVRVKRYDDGNYGLGADGGINITVQYQF